MAKRHIYKVYTFGMYSKYRVFSRVYDTDPERIEKTKEYYKSRGFDCGNTTLYPHKTTEKDYQDIHTPL